mmetsp:Transcript_9487/g.15514  ORF Transcript_9487/g.15514 Transcript_9487/m.15514 type:complete len:126 (+) Transcript_9487:161-538(+)
MDNSLKHFETHVARIKNRKSVILANVEKDEAELRFINKQLESIKPRLEKVDAQIAEKKEERERLQKLVADYEQGAAQLIGNAHALLNQTRSKQGRLLVAGSPKKSDSMRMSVAASLNKSLQIVTK